MWLTKKLLPWARLYKKAAYKQYSPQQEHFAVRELVNLAFGTGYRYAWAHRFINGRDIGKFNRWADDYGKRLSSSFASKQKKRLQVLQESGFGPESPEFDLAHRRYKLLLEGVNREKAAMKERVYKAIKRTGVYDKATKIQQRANKAR